MIIVVADPWIGKSGSFVLEIIVYNTWIIRKVDCLALIVLK